MKTWTRVILTIPAEHRDAANRMAALFDYDTGGGDTFGACALSPTGEEPATHYMANTLIRQDYLSTLDDPEQALAALTALAEEYDREPPTEADVQAWCDNAIIGTEQPEGLLRVVPESLGP
tara:strand:+ start:9941 stop:10303 length:363 start_codon:yes stop_codon:yes gene_type:complete